MNTLRVQDQDCLGLRMWGYIQTSSDNMPLFVATFKTEYWNTDV